MKSAKQTQVRQVLESVVSITDEQESHLFRRNLAFSVREMMEMDEIAFARPQTSLNSNTEFGLVYLDSALSHRSGALRKRIEDPNGILSHNNILKMMSQGYLSILQQGVVLVLLPVIYKERLIEIIVVSAATMPKDALFLLRGYARLYRNFLGLIVENQTDSLTGLLNRKAMESRLMSIIRDAKRGLRTELKPVEDKRQTTESAEAFLAVIDIDHFKQINDTKGHLFGDEVIILIARLMQEVFRTHDLVFRFGGEEFVVVVLAPDQGSAATALERFREQVSTHRFPQIDQVTISAGFTRIGDQETPSSLLGKADQALYYAKEHGRNQVCDYDQLIKEGQLNVFRSESDIELF